MLFELIAGLAGIFTIGCEVATSVINYNYTPVQGGKYANAGYEPMTPTTPITPVFDPETAPVLKPKNWTDWANAYNTPAESKDNDTPLTKWVTDNADELVELLKTPEFLINKGKYDTAIENEIIDFIFKQPNVESAEAVNDGIFVVTRGVF